MTTETNDEQNPFTRPGFIVSAVIVVIIAVLAVVVTVLAINRPDPTPPATHAPATSTAPEEPAQPSTDAASVCGLRGGGGDTVTTAPDAVWKFQGTTAYPVSKDAGPALEENGVRTCFQPSATGALLFAANAAVQASDPATAEAWLQTALAAGPYYDELSNSEGASDKTGSRMEIVGFRVLAYTGETSTVDLALRLTTANGNTGYVTSVYSLVWESGDWKISTENQVPIDIAALPDTTGYIPWGSN